jgi:hypothetical protein
MTQPSNMQRYSENPGKHYPCSNIRRYYDEIPYYDEFPYDDTPYSTLPYDDLPYDDTPYDKTPYDKTHYDTIPYDGIHYDKTHYDAIPFDGKHYDIILHDSTRTHPVLYSRPPHDRSSLAIPCTLNQFQELSSQSVMKFFPHFSHPPYN